MFILATAKCSRQVSLCSSVGAFFFSVGETYMAPSRRCLLAALAAAAILVHFVSTSGASTDALSRTSPSPMSPVCGASSRVCGAKDQFCTFVAHASPAPAGQAWRAALRDRCPSGVTVDGDSMGRQFFLRLVDVLRSGNASLARSQKRVMEHYFHANATYTVASDGRGADTLALTLGERRSQMHASAVLARFRWRDADQSCAPDPCTVCVFGYQFLYAKHADACATIASGAEGRGGVAILPPALERRHELSGLNSRVAARNSCVRRLFGGVDSVVVDLDPDRGYRQQRCDGMHFTCQAHPRLDLLLRAAEVNDGRAPTCAVPHRHLRDRRRCACTEGANVDAAVDVLNRWLNAATRAR
jgi:hypothetical protein